MSTEAWAIGVILKYEMFIRADIGYIRAGGTPCEITEHWELGDLESFYDALEKVATRRQKQIQERKR